MIGYHLAATPKTTHWRLFDFELAPVVNSDGGGSITIDTMINGRAVHLTTAGFELLPDYSGIRGDVVPEPGSEAGKQRCGF